MKHKEKEGRQTECDMCGKNYTYETIMGRHEKLKQSQCDQCSERNGDTRNINKHKETLHEEKERN